jgi:hypothetical protein
MIVFADDDDARGSVVNTYQSDNKTIGDSYSLVYTEVVTKHTSPSRLTSRSTTTSTTTVVDFSFPKRVVSTQNR